MQGRIRRATAIGAATFALAGSAALAMPGTASAAETKTVPCGSTVEANAGDTIHGTLLGLPLIDLGVVTVSKTLTATVNALLGTVCQVTVTVVNTVVAPVPVVGAPAADALNSGVAGVTNGVSGGINATQRALSGNPPAQQQPGGAPGNPQSPGSPNAPAGGNPAGVTPIPDSNSPVLAGGFTAPNFSGLPFTFSTGYAPMRDYSNIPMVNAGLYSPSPGLRYGGQVPGYAPEFGILGQAAQQPLGGGVQNAGQAEALPGTGGGMVDGAGLPLLIAVLSLSAVSAVLVRTWVLRRMAAAT